MTKICCIGHITLDKVITPRFSVDMPGGTAFYFGHAMSNLPHEGFRLVTSLGESEKKAVDDLRATGIDVAMIPSRQSVCFENKYGEDINHRTQRVLAKADPFTIDALKDEEAEIFHLGTLLADDFSPEVLKYLSDRGRVSVDAQGYLREVRGENVYPVDWKGKEEALPCIDILKVNEHEMEAITGLSDPRAAAEKLADMGVKEVVITLGSEGSLIYHEGMFYEIPAYEAKDVVDATGCGDTYMAGYLYKRSLGCPIDECGKFAAAMCTIKLGAAGPFSASESDVESVINS